MKNYDRFVLNSMRPTIVAHPTATRPRVFIRRLIDRITRMLIRSG